MTASRGHVRKLDPIAQRSLEILDQMTAQLIASRDWAAADQERLQRIRADLAKLVHWAMHDHGNPEMVARIRDCYRRCELDIDDTTVMRRIRGAVKGVMRKAGVDTTVPGLDPALDAETIMITTKRTIQRMGGAASSSATTSPALDRKPGPTAAPVPPPADPPPPTPLEPPSTKRQRAAPAAKAPAAQEAPAAKEAAVTPSDMAKAFDLVVDRTLAQIQRSGRSLERADYLAAVYNDDAKKARLLDQIAGELPPVDRTRLGQAVDGFFRSAFKGSYIERTDRQGNRRAQKR